jgi:hypothetical protein
MRRQISTSVVLLSALHRSDKTRFLIMTILALVVSIAMYGQSNTREDTCLVSEFKNIDLLIPGSADTIQENGIRVRVVDPASLINGFELQCPDSLVRIVRFRLVFDNKVTGNLYTKVSKGNVIADDDKQLFSLADIKNATLITIEEISFRFKGICYRTNSQVYLCR